MCMPNDAYSGETGVWLALFVGFGLIILLSMFGLVMIKQSQKTPTQDMKIEQLEAKFEQTINKKQPLSDKLKALKELKTEVVNLKKELIKSGGWRIAKAMEQTNINLSSEDKPD